MPGIEGATAIAGGVQHFCAVGAGGRVWCWGSNSGGQLGSGSRDPDIQVRVPVEVPGLTGATALAAGYEYTCALMTGGTVSCWGTNPGSTYEAPLIDAVPTQVPGIEGATAIAGSMFDMCALVADGTVRCWGRNESGQLGDGTTNRHTEPGRCGRHPGRDVDRRGLVPRLRRGRWWRGPVLGLQRHGRAGRWLTRDDPDDGRGR